MGFLKDFKDDFSQAVNELMPAEEETMPENVFTPVEIAEEPSNTVIQENMMEKPAVKDAADFFAEESFTDEIPVEGIFAEEENIGEPTEGVLLSFSEEEVQEEMLQGMDAYEEAEESEATDEMTTISKGVRLEGNLNSKGSVELLGDVTGDVKCNGKLLVYGTIIGNPTASEIYANTARIEGNVTSSGSVKIGAGSVIIGNLSASSVVVGGAVKGDIDVNGPVIIDSTAVVVGNIKSRTVQINNGAVVDGFVSLCYAGAEIDRIFAPKK